MKRRAAMAALGGAAATAFLSGSPASARPFAAPIWASRPKTAPEAPDRLRTWARNAVIYDLETGEALFEKGADRAIPPASMTKLMTLYLVFEALRSGDLRLEHRLTVSERAAATGGSSMFLEPGEAVQVDNLIRGVVVDSGNDAAVTLAEALAGTESAFARRMTARAADLGLRSARFLNATGLPIDGHVISVRDLARLASLLIADFPEYYAYFGERVFSWGGIRQENRNPLLGRVKGVDGMKTGHTDAAGYCIVVSAEREKRRVLIVLAGLETEDDRAREAKRAVAWAFDRVNG